MGMMNSKVKLMMILREQRKALYDYLSGLMRASRAVSLSHSRKDSPVVALIE
jgi:hypothetical protein